MMLLMGCQGKKEADPLAGIAKIDLPQIRERGKLIAATGYGATSYFIYKGQPMGYEYELLERLADHLDLEVELKIVRDMDEVFDVLNKGEADIIALGLTVTKERAQKIAFTRHHNTIRQVLVQRKPDNWRLMKLHEIDRLLIRDPIDLIGKQVHVWSGSSYYSRLANLSDEIGGDIDIVPVSGDLSTEELIGMVADGEIDYTVADEHIARINSSYYSNIDIETPVSFPQRIAWAVRKTSPELLAAVDDWVTEMKGGVEYYALYNKYYKDRRAFRERARSQYYAFKGGAVSKYDSLIKVCADDLNWDWRLMASMIYQESGFDPGTRSWAGATGLMQLMPETGKQFGGKDLYDPVENLHAGTNYLKWLDKIWKDVPDSLERIKFILASYNAGQGHVFDARKLARKYGKDPAIWDDNVAYYVLKKSSKEFFNDDVVEHGYCRGEEPFNYVNEVLDRYEHYKRLVSL